MPEGPEVKTVARTLHDSLVSKKLGLLWHSSFKLRRAVDYSKLKDLEHKVITSVDAYGKVLFISCENKPVILAQLGMTGQLKVEARDAPLLTHTHIRWELADSQAELRYVDPRRFGLFDRCDEQLKNQIINKLGPDPFSLKKSQIEPLAHALGKSRRAIKEVLLDQAVIAGVGNIYASEALFLAKVSPLAPACDLSSKQLHLIIKAVVQVMAQAYENCGTSFSNYVDGSGTKGKNLDFLQVFQRQGQACFSCQESILRVKQGGRSTFYCPHCQS